MQTKTTIFLFLLFSFITPKIESQTWSSVGNGLVTGTTGNVNAMAEYNGELYVAGQFASAGTNVALSIAKWDGTNWSGVNIGLTNGSNLATVTSLQVYNGALYVGGSFLTAGGNIALGIAKWNGSNWSAVGNINLLGIISVDVTAMTVHNGELYACGKFLNLFGQQTTVVKWNGTAWSKVGTGIGSATVNTLCSYNGQLYAGGLFPLVGSTPLASIAKWNGTAWSAVASAPNPPINILKVYGGELYAGTTIASLNTNAISKWNCSVWSSAGSGILGEVKTFHIANNELYVGGTFFSFTGNPGNSIAKWNGTSWSALGSGLDNGVYAIADYKNELYAGGLFLTSGATTLVNFIAIWSELVGIEDNSINNKINVFPNPSNGLITIESKEHTIESIRIYNTLGELLYLEEKKNLNTSLNITDFSNGVYVIKITTDKGIADKRIVIAK